MINPPYRFDPLQNPVDIAGEGTGGSPCPWHKVDESPDYDPDKYGINTVLFTSGNPCTLFPNGPAVATNGHVFYYIYQSHTYYHFDG